MTRSDFLRRRIRFWLSLFILGLVLSGVTAIPLAWELDVLARWVGPGDSGLAHWIGRVQGGLHETYARYPFVAYGTDWLAFGHLMIAVAFVGPLRDPVRNRWVITFGLIACVLVVPWALVFGPLRGIPFFWRLIDCSFGVFGIVPLWLCRRDIDELERRGGDPMKPLLLALATGLLFAFSLPPYDQEWLGWFAFAPLLLAAQGRRPLEAVGLGLIAGAVCGAAQAGWHHDTTRLFWAYIPFLWLAFLLGFVALAAAKVPAAWNPTRRVLFLACAGIAGEWLTSFLPLPLNIALCQYGNLPLIQIASVTGIWGVSFLLWWANAALAEFVPRNSPLAPTTGGTGEEEPIPSYSPIIGDGGAVWKAAPLAIGAALALLSLGYGGLRLAHTPAATPRLRVAAIQDLTREEMGDLAPAAGETDRALLTGQAAARGAKFIVWSEESLGGEFAPDNAKDETRLLARRLGTALVVGYSDSTRPKPFNCAAYLASDGAVLSPVHHKIHLYLSERETNQPGHSATVVATPQGRVGLEICFDSCYTNTTRQEAGQGAQIIALPNYDPPSPRGVLHRLHGAMLPFRAVENAVPFVRADSNGLSQIVDAEGRFIGQSPLFRPDVLVGDVALGDGRGTFFTRFGDWLAYVCLVVVAASILICLCPQRKPNM